ncbi:MAG: transglycosylase SLT domain-containing protein [Myxococcota bacterium]
MIRVRISWVELNLAEALRRRGNYEFAMQRFDRVAKSGDDDLSDRALSAAGQMAVQHRKYEEAQAHFEAALVRNPVGPARHRALWGLGWVAFRTGDFLSAIQFFQTLELEAPYDPLTPRARYWRARSHDERRELEVAQALMVHLVEEFPVDYYAYRAAEWLGSKHLRDATYPRNPASDHPRVTAASSLYRAGMPVRATRALRRALGVADALGPHELLRLEAMAYELQADRIAKRLRLAREHRFPLGEQARESIRKFYPAASVNLLRRAAKKSRVDAGLLVAVARRESGFNARAVSNVGAVGLLQLMPRTAGSLLKEEGGKLASPQMLMDPKLNARLGSRYLGRMLRAFRGREEYALAAYNAGPGAVTRWRATRGDLPDDIFAEEIPYRETRRYVRRVLSAMRAFELATSEVPVEELPTSYDEMLAVSYPSAAPSSER